MSNESSAYINYTTMLKLSKQLCWCSISIWVHRRNFANVCIFILLLDNRIIPINMIISNLSQSVQKSNVYRMLPRTSRIMPHLLLLIEGIISMAIQIFSPLKWLIPNLHKPIYYLLDCTINAWRNHENCYTITKKIIFTYKTKLSVSLCSEKYTKL